MVDHPGVHLVKFTQVACQQIPRILTGVEPEPSHLRGGMLSTFFQRLWFCWGRGWEPYLIEQYARVGELMSSVLGGQHPIHIQSRFQIGHIGKRATKWVVLMDITGKGRGLDLAKKGQPLWCGFGSCVPRFCAEHLAVRVSDDHMQVQIASHRLLTTAITASQPGGDKTLVIAQHLCESGEHLLAC